MKNINNAKQKSVDIEDFLKKSTSNYTKFEKSICGKIYYIEERVIVADKALISSLENEIVQIRIEFENRLKEIKNMKLTGSFLEKITFASKKKKLISEATKKFEDSELILQNRLKNAQEVFEKDRILLQELINKVEATGIKWYELKRLIQEKIARGFLIHKNLISRSRKKSDLYLSKAIKREKVINDSNITDGGKTYKEKNLSNKQEIYKIKGLTPAQQQEYDEILKHILFKKNECKNPKIVLKFRDSLLKFDNEKYKNMALFLGSKAIYDNLFMYFVKDGGLQYQSDYESLFSGAGAITTKSQFFRDRATKVLRESGYDNEYIKNNLKLYQTEIERLYSSPSDMQFILNNLSNSKINDINMNKKFEDEIKREINKRLEARAKENVKNDKSQEAYQNVLARK